MNCADLIDSPRAVSYVRKLLPAIVTALVALPIFLSVAPLDPDLHHDGVQLAVAIAVSEGSTIHLDVFSQYGPFTGTLQGIWLTIFQPTLLNLRNLAALELTFIAVMMTAIGRQLGLPRALSTLVAISWVLLCPVWSIGDTSPGSLLPWTSIDFLVLSLTSASLFILSSSRTRAKPWILFLSGLLIGAAAFTRLQIAVAIVIIWMLSLLFVAGRDVAKIRIFAPFATGLSLSYVFGVSALYFQGALSEYVGDAIVGPLNFYTESSINLYLGILLFTSIPVALFLWPPNSRQPSGMDKWRVKWLTGLQVAILVVIAVAGLAPIFLDAGYGSSTITKRINFLAGNMQHSILLVSIFVSGICYFLTIKRNLRFKSSTTSDMADEQLNLKWNESTYINLGLYSIALASGLQIYPSWSGYHVWWSAPLALIITVWFLWNSRMPTLPIRFRVTSLLLIVALCGFFQFQYLLNKPRENWSSLGVMQGMQLRPTEYDRISNIQQFLEPYDGEKYDSYCRDGVLSVWFGKYANVNKAYVSWYWLKDIAPASGVPVLYCADSYIDAREYSHANALRILESDPLIGMYWMAK